jgi:two-component system chemotaxis response regulator CheY
MPEMDGIEATKRIKQIDPNARILIVSALGQESYVKEAIIGGAKDFIVKPFKENVLVEKITRLCNLQNM